MIHQAIEFASLKHKHQKRKGTNIPYIVHPVEVMYILKEEGFDEDTVISGLLHDTVEDTKTTINEIEEKFNKTIANYVNALSEDKSKHWVERKKEHLNDVKNSCLNVKAIFLADKLANLRSIAQDIDTIKEDTWKKFNSDKQSIGWYYSSALNICRELENLKMYKEVEKLFNYIFN